MIGTNAARESPIQTVSMIPEKIGRYEIRRELGRGGMATVYFARDPRFKRDVAVKVLPREFLHDPTFRTRFEREAQTIASLEHPAIVPVYDFGEEDKQPYLVMRYMPGGSLADRLRDGPLPLAKVTRLLAHLAPALDEAHARGIIHRDLKPANILFDQRGNPYISDFGLVKLSEDGLTSITSGFIVGTPAYISPEQAHGMAHLDGRSDIYALGVIVFEMLTGKTPYNADTPMGIVVKHITEPVPLLLDTMPDLAPACETVIARAMAKNRDERFSTAGEMVAALEKASQGDVALLEPIDEAATVILSPGDDPATVALPTSNDPVPSLAARNVSPPAASTPEQRRRRLAWVWLLLLGLLACGGLGAWLSLNNSLPAAGPRTTETPSRTAPVDDPLSTPTPTAKPATSTLAASPTTETSLITPDRPVLVLTSTVASGKTKLAQPTQTSPVTSGATQAPRPSDTPRPPATPILGVSPTRTPPPTATNTAVPPSNTPPSLPTATRTHAPLPTNTPPPTNTPTPADTQGPAITGLDANPKTVGALNGCSVTFSATISDPSGVSAASVNWTSFNALGGQTGSGSATMGGPATGGAWTTSFGVSIPLSGRLEWSVNASDAIGNSAGQGGGPSISAIAPC